MACSSTWVAATLTGGSPMDSQCSALHTIVAPSEEFPTIQATFVFSQGSLRSNGYSMPQKLGTLMLIISNVANIVYFPKETRRFGGVFDFYGSTMPVPQSIGNQQPGSPWCGTFRRAPPSSLATWHTEWSTNCLVPFDPGIHEFSQLVINSRVGELKACSGWSQLMARFLLAYISFMGSQVDKVTEVKCGWWQWQLRLHHGVHEVDTLELRSPVLLEGSGVREVGQLRLLRSIVRWVVDATSWDDGTYCNVTRVAKHRWKAKMRDR